MIAQITMVKLSMLRDNILDEMQMKELRKVFYQRSPTKDFQMIIIST